MILSGYIFLNLVRNCPNGSKENKKLLSNKNKIHSFIDDNFVYVIYQRLSNKRE